jgi:hypothetical protein
MGYFWTLLISLIAFHLLMGRDAYGNTPITVDKKYQWILKSAYLLLGSLAYIGNSVYFIMYIASEILEGRKEGFVHPNYYNSLVTEILYMILCVIMIGYLTSFLILLNIRYA